MAIKFSNNYINAADAEFGALLDDIAARPRVAGETQSAEAGKVAPLLGNLSIGLAIGQAVGGMYAGWKGGKTASYVASRQAEIAEENRKMAQLSAETAMRQGEAAVAQITYRAGQVKAKQRAAFAANGIALGTGSTAEVAASADVMKEIDKRTAEMNALSAAWGYKSQALAASARSSVYSGTASHAKSLGMAKGLGSLLEGGASAADRWYRYFGA